jgi:NADH-quinone oxidoreductase subunit L
MNGPLIILMILALVGGFIHVPVEAVFSHGEAHDEHHVSGLIHGIMIAVPLIGIGISYLFFMSKTFSVEKLMSSGLAQSLHKFWLGGWGFDTLYNAMLVNPFLFLARINRKDLVDSFYALIVTLSQVANGMIVRTQTGSLRWYALTLVGGLVIIVTLGVLL